MTCCRWAYRLRQGIAWIVATLRPGAMDEEPARQRLAPRAWDLFRRMSPGDRAHALCVLARLEARGPVAPWLAEAALLHDVGKSEGRLTLLHRTAIVLLGSRLRRWATNEPTSWRYPLRVHLRHAQRGAELCAQAGCDQRTVSLVGWHETPSDAGLDGALRDDLAALRAADDRC